MKSILITIVTITFIVVLVYVYRQKVEPKIWFEEYDKITKSGRIAFGGHVNHFGPNNGWNMSARGGWDLLYNFENGVPTFKLFKDGVFLRSIPLP